MSLKMYVLIRSDLSDAQQAVQAGHAVALFARENWQEFKAWQDDSSILIYLSVEDIDWWNHALADGKFKHSMFCETSSYWYPNGQNTAIAVAPNWTCQYLLFKDLPLALQPAAPVRKRWWQR